ncbi:hypothetical protein NDU88_004708 [Pleurodeles waltl]|uniref:Uncharacterized protein n=1 Tax=Pleurodeles waltl TaxID=8319 RepID=A0AAV7LM59_PLEWA|nr:hypothetical protein NDU88_004708 [Pleurodeles waltl]
MSAKRPDRTLGLSGGVKRPYAAAVVLGTRRWVQKKQQQRGGGRRRTEETRRESLGLRSFRTHPLPGCALYAPTTKRLRAEGLAHALLFPARLRATYNQKAHFFATPELVRNWLDTTFSHLGPKEHEDALPLRQACQPRKDK